MILVLGRDGASAETLRKVEGFDDVVVVGRAVPGPADRYVVDERRAEAEARRRVDAVVARLRGGGVEAHGFVGGADAAFALRDAQALFPGRRAVVVEPSRPAAGVVRAWSVPPRDIGASLVTVAAALVVVANMHGWNWPLIGGDRASVAVLALLGVAAYLLRPAAAEPRDAVTGALAVVGAGAVVLVATGLAVGSHVVLALLLSLLLLVWSVLTLRHEVDRRSLRAERQRSQAHPG